MVAHRLRAEILIDDRIRPRAVSLLRGLEASAAGLGVRANAVAHYTGTDPVLILWGAGDPIRNRTFNQHIANGGIGICWDMGYWAQGRGNETFGMNRMSIGAMHPQKWVMREKLKRSRFLLKPLELSDTWDPEGHIVLAGLGPKTCDQYCLRMGEWERRKLAQIQEALPGRRVIFRPKPGNPYTPIGIEADHDSPIRDLLKGAALVVCRHSNVAIDALCCGVPSAVDDGAAAALYDDTIAIKARVSDDVRDQFLRNLAWFQWTTQECWTGEPWEFICRMLEAHEPSTRSHRSTA